MEARLGYRYGVKPISGTGRVGDGFIAGGISLTTKACVQEEQSPMLSRLDHHLGAARSDNPLDYHLVAAA